MYALKDKVSEKLSRLFVDSPSSSSSPTSTRHDPPAWSDALGGKSLSSYFSYINPSTVFSGSKSTKQHHDLKPLQSTPIRYSSINNDFSEEQLDNFAECDSVCRTKFETIITHQEDKKCGLVGEKKDKLNNEGDDEDQGSGGSTSDSEVFEEAMEQHSPQKSLPNITDDSVFISRDLYEFFLSCLPNIVKGCKWVLLYSTLKDGISLRTLIRKSNDLSCPCLLIVGDKQGAVFGGLLECPLKPTPKRKYQGTNQTFVFTTIYGEPRLFRPTGANRYYYLCLNDTLALGGGGHFALCLDGDLLNGTSGPCETFGNVCLAHDPEFELKNVELWGFIHASQYHHP